MYGILLFGRQMGLRAKNYKNPPSSLFLGTNGLIYKLPWINFYNKTAMIFDAISIGNFPSKDLIDIGTLVKIWPLMDQYQRTTSLVFGPHFMGTLSIEPTPDPLREFRALKYTEFTKVFLHYYEKESNCPRYFIVIQVSSARILWIFWRSLQHAKCWLLASSQGKLRHKTCKGWAQSPWIVWGSSSKSNIGTEKDITSWYITEGKSIGISVRIE